MSTERSLPKYFLTVALVLFLICGFTVTPIAAAEIGYTYDIHITPAPPELVEQYSAATAAAVSQKSVAYKDLMTASAPSGGYVTITAADITNYLRTHPEVTELKVNGEMVAAADVEYYLQNHPDFTVDAPPSLICDDLTEPPVDPSGMYVTVTADDITNYLHTHPEFWGGTFEGQAFTAADIDNYLQIHPDFTAALYFDPEDYGEVIGITALVAFVIVAIAGLVVTNAAADILVIALFGTCLFVGYGICVVMLIIDIVYSIIAACENGWEQVLILPVLFAIWSRKRKMQRISPSSPDNCA